MEEDRLANKIFAMTIFYWSCLFMKQPKVSWMALSLIFWKKLNEEQLSWNTLKDEYFFRFK